MDNASGHFAMLAGAGAAIVVLSIATNIGPLSGTSGPDQSAVVVTVPQRPVVAAPPAKASPAAVVAPTSGASLARALQSELKRVGCYDGDVSGIWNARSRMAMKAFTERVNATLPVDNPDQILLALVQGHRTRVCDGATCQSGRMPAAGGRCLPGAVAARDADKVVPRETAVPGPSDPKPMIVAPPVLVTRKPAPAVAVPAPRVAERRSPSAEPAATPVAPSNPPRREADNDGPVPAVGVYERDPHPRHVAGHIPKPVAYARSLLRKLQRAAEAAW